MEEDVSVEERVSGGECDYTDDQNTEVPLISFMRERPVFLLFYSTWQVKFPCR